MRRELEVICWSRRLAVGPVTGTPLEGRVYWPEPADLAQHFAREIQGEAGFMIPAFLFVTQKQIAAARKAAVKLVRERHREA